MIDSLLGATLQERRCCPLCETITEQPRHRRCGSATHVIGGVPGLNNDAVNLFAIAAGAAVAAFLTAA